MIAAVTLALLAACPVNPPCRPVAGACEVAPFRVVADPGAVDCAAVAADVATTRAHFELGRLGEGEFDAAFEGLVVYVHRSVRFHSAEGERVGRYSAVDGIDLGAHGDALPHELMHALDAREGHVWTGWHWFWDWEFDDAVTAEMTGRWVPEPLEAEGCEVGR